MTNFIKASLFLSVILSATSFAQTHTEIQQGDPSLKPETITLSGDAQKTTSSTKNKHPLKHQNYELQKGDPNLKSEKLPVAQ